MADRRSALFWAVAWWFARRWLRRRAAVTVAGITAGAAARRGRMRAVVGAILLVGVLAGAFVVWRKLAGGEKEQLASPDASAPRTESPVPTATA
jgi:hypothetical protein